ncbi:hypothetical protein, partial [Burkholderia cepacia]|uniref:hypothetical protein n=2 Tax=Burkholderia cepacia TaxID=292 RepID=UPI001C400732
PSSACFRANAICSSVNLLVFMAWPSCPRGHIMPNFSTFAPDYFLGQGQVAWYNHHQLMEPLGYIPPAEAEANYYRQLRNAAKVSALT